MKTDKIEGKILGQIASVKGQVAYIEITSNTFPAISEILISPDEEDLCAIQATYTMSNIIKH